MRAGLPDLPLGLACRLIKVSLRRLKLRCLRLGCAAYKKIYPAVAKTAGQWENK
jgi:hypothetical protein